MANDHPRRLSINFPRLEGRWSTEQPDDDRLQFRWWYGIIHLRGGRQQQPGPERRGESSLDVIRLSLSHPFPTLTNVSQGTHPTPPRRYVCRGIGVYGNARRGFITRRTEWKDDHGSAGELRYGPMWFSMQIELFACHYANKSNDASRMYRVMQLL